MSKSDADRFFEDAFAWASQTGRTGAFNDVLARLHLDLQGDPTALAQMRTLLERLREAAAIEAPEAWVRAATTRIAELEAAATSDVDFLDRARAALREAIQVIEARLVGDTFAGQALQGIRGSTALQPRQLHYVSEVGDVHLQVEPGDRGHSIIGQFVPSSPEYLDIAIEAQATSSGGTTIVELDPGAQFHFTDVRDGEIRIELSMGKECLDLAPFWIRSRQEE